MFKLRSLKLIFSLFAISLLYISGTNAYFSDSEAVNVSLSSASLDISVSPSTLSYESITPGFSTNVPIVINNLGTTGYNFTTTVDQTGGDSAFCDAITTTPSATNISISFTSNTSSLQNKTCNLEVVYKAHQDNSDGTWGFTDTEKVSLSFSSGSWVADPPSEPELPKVVINELMPDPIGDDRAYRPNGEWIELYNPSEQTVYLMGWYLTDGQNHDLPLTDANTTSESIPPHGFVVVYRNNDSSFSLNNSSTEETVRLYDNNHVQRDSLSYGSAHDLRVSEDKTVSRYRDGENTLYITIPTLGSRNVLSPALSFSVTTDKHYASFKVSHIEPFSSLNYEIEYKKKTGPKETLSGSALLSGQAEYEKSNIELGSCSTGGTCVFPEGVKDIKLTITLHKTSGPDFILESKID